MAKRVLTLNELPGVLGAMENVTGKAVSIGIADPELARLARVLEYGSIAGQKPWPCPGEKTVLAEDPITGTTVVVSAQAPSGFIRVAAPAILRDLRNHIAGTGDWLDPEGVNQRSDATVAMAAKIGLNRIRQLIPQKSGQLRDSLQVLDG
ncbi:MAG: hypothetical protein ACREUP_13210 [Burkholderiales bacterium]